MKSKLFMFTTSLLLIASGISVASAVTLQKPTNVLAEAQGTEINLSFSGIAGNNYIATCREYVGTTKGALAPFKTSYTSPITIKGLKQNSTYKCFVANNTNATKNWENIVGTDDDTVKFDWVPAVVSGTTNTDLILTKSASTTPSNIRVIPAASSIAVFFDYPTNAQSVNANCTPKTGGAQLTLSSDSSPIVLMGANSNSAYSCFLTASYSGGVNSTPSSNFEVTVPASTTGVPSTPGINAVALKGNQLIVTVIPPINGSSITSFVATCVNSSNKKSFTNTSTTYKISITVDQLAVYNCTAAAQGPYGKSLESGVFTSSKSSTNSSTLRFKIEGSSSGGSFVTLTAPFDSSAVIVKFSCFGRSTQNYGREVSSPVASISGKSPSAKLDLSYGDWECSYQNTTSAGVGLESAHVKVAVTLPAPKMKLTGNKLIVSKPASWIGAWSVVCSGSDSTQVVKTSSTNSLTLSLAKGSWKCAGSLKGQITSLKSVKV